MSQDDDAWFQRTLQGDQRAFEVLVRRYERLVFRIGRGFLRDRRMWKMRRRRRSSEHSGTLAVPIRLPHSAPGSPNRHAIVLRPAARQARARRWAGGLCPRRAAGGDQRGRWRRIRRRTANRDLAERVLTGGLSQGAAMHPACCGEVMGYTAAESAKALGARTGRPDPTSPGTGAISVGGRLPGRDGSFGV